MSPALNIGLWGAIVLALTVGVCGRLGDAEETSSTRIPQPDTVPPAPSPTPNAQSTVTSDTPPAPSPPTSTERSASTAEAPTSLSRPDPALTPDVQGLATTGVPGDLASATLPADVSGISTLVANLPPTVAGHARTTALDRITPAGARAGYGEDWRLGFGGSPLLAVQAINIELSDFWPTNWTAGQVVTVMARHGEEVKDVGRDGKLVWMRQNTFMGAADSEARFPVYTMAWGLIDSPWMFTVQADSAENRDALLAAFVAATKSALPAPSRAGQPIHASVGKPCDRCPPV